jgi:hypothetical protein
MEVMDYSSLPVHTLTIGTTPMQTSDTPSATFWSHLSTFLLGLGSAAMAWYAVWRQRLMRVKALLGSIILRETLTSEQRGTTMQATSSHSIIASSLGKSPSKEIQVNILAVIESAISAIKSNPEVEQYAEPIILALFTGAATIVLPQGTIKISQSGTPSRFTIGLAALAIETFIFSPGAPDSIQIGTTQITYTPAVNASSGITGTSV